MTDAKHSQDGFTLIEVLVALFILAITAAVLFPQIGSGLHSAGQSGQSLRLNAAARSVLDSLGSNISLRDGKSQGETADNLHWTVMVRPYEGWSASSDTSFEAKLVTVSVSSTTDGDGNSWQVQTLRLAKKEGT